MMKVFTSIFVLEGQRSTFEDIEEALRAEEVHSEAAKVSDLPRRHVVELHVKTEPHRYRTDGNV